MRIYSNKFELTQPVERQIYVAPNSIYAIGVKVTKNGEAADGTLSVFVGSSALTPMEATVDGYALYQMTSPAEPAVTIYDVVYTKGTTIQHFKLIGNTTNSTVFDIDQEGGAMELPIASAGVLGGVKVGETLSIVADGVLNVNSQLSVENLTVQGTAQFYNGTVTVDPANFLDYSTGERAIEQHTTHNFEVEYEDGETESFTIWTNS